MCSLRITLKKFSCYQATSKSTLIIPVLIPKVINDNVERKVPKYGFKKKKKRGKFTYIYSSDRERHL